MKGLIALAVTVLLFSCSVALSQEDPREAELRTLRAEVELHKKTAEARLDEIRRLKIEIEDLKKQSAQIDDLKRGIEALKTQVELLKAENTQLAKKVGPDPTAVGQKPEPRNPTQKETTYVYRGKQIMAADFELLYLKYRDRVICATGGQFYVLPQSEPPKIVERAVSRPDEGMPQLGEYRRIVNRKVRRILSSDEVILDIPGVAGGPVYSRNAPPGVRVIPWDVEPRPSTTVYVKGRKTAGMIDGQEINATVMYIGPYRTEYGDSIQGYVVASYSTKVLTKKEFAAALKTDLDLRD
jgi:regulator of replication initiation timing